MKTALMPLLLILSCVESITPSIIPDPPTCSQNNPFIPWLQAGQVHIYSTPHLSNETSCSSEWSTHGTCCGVESLIEYAKSDSGDIQTRANQMHQEVMIAFEAINLLRKGLLLIRRNMLAGRIQLTGSQLAAGETLQGLAQSASEAASKLGAFLAYIGSKNESLVEAQTACGHKLNQMRSSSLCSLCSGRVSVFLLNGKAIVEEEDCSSFVQECFQSWETMILIASEVRYGQIVAKKFSEYGTKLFSNFDGVAINRISDWLSSSRVAEYLQECGSQGYEGCSAAIKANICHATLNLAKPTYLKSIVRSPSSILIGNISLTTKIGNLEEKISSIELKIRDKNITGYEVKYTLERLNLLLRLLKSKLERQQNNRSIETQNNWASSPIEQEAHRRRLQTHDFWHTDSRLLRVLQIGTQAVPYAAKTGQTVTDTDIVPHSSIPAGSYAISMKNQFP